MRTFVFFRAALLAATIAFAACKGCDGDETPHHADTDVGDLGTPDASACDDGVVRAEVAASPWVTQLVGVASYRFVGAVDVNELVIELLDADGAVLGTLTVQQLVADADGFAAGTMHAALVPAGGEPLSLYTRGITDEDGYTVQSTLRGASEVEVHAGFSFTRCENAPQELPPCLFGLPVDEPGFSVGACGLALDTQAAYGRHPRLRGVRYFVSRDEAAGEPATGGIAGGAREGYVLDVHGEHGTAPAADLRAWLDATGAGRTLGTPAERLLTLTYADRAWRDAFFQSALECQGAAAPGALCPAPNALGCTSGTNRDADAWGNLGGAPAAIRLCVGGCSGGDPHLVSFDGEAFDFQGAGEFVAARSLSDPSFEVQVRSEPMESAARPSFCGGVSANTATAFRFGDHRVSIFSRRTPALWVDGQPVTDIAAAAFPGTPPGSSWDLSPPNYRFRWGTGEEVEFIVGGYSSLYVRLPPARLGDVVGLFGTFTGNRLDDFTTAAGATLDAPVPFGELYGEFGTSWRVPWNASLFDYADGESPANYLDPDYPASVTTIADLPADARADAETICREREIVDPWWFDACVLDVACASGDASAAGFAGARADADAATQVGAFSWTSSGAIRPRPGATSVRAGELRPQAACTENIANVIWGLTEAEGATLSAPLQLDFSGTGAVEDAGDLTALSVPTGEPLHSHLLHFDRDGEAEPLPASGSVTYSVPILGIIVTGAGHDASDELAAAGLDYPPASERGLELGEDRVQISEDRRTLTVTLRGDDTIDQIRVILDAGGMP